MSANSSDVYFKRHKPDGDKTEFGFSRGAIWALFVGLAALLGSPYAQRLLQQATGIKMTVPDDANKLKAPQD